MGKSVEVDDYMAGLEHPMAAQVESLRSVILGADPRVSESIKWNAPSFYIDEHFATFNLHYPDRVQIVLHTGAKVNPDARQVEIDDPGELLKWPSVDRATITFSDPDDVASKTVAFASIVRQWIQRTT